MQNKFVGGSLLYVLFCETLQKVPELLFGFSSAVLEVGQ